MDRDIYLDNISVEEAQNKWYSNLQLEPQIEKLDVRQAKGRITSQPLISKVSAPHYHASAMDGIAVKAEKTAGASEKNSISLQQGIDYQLVDTGDPLPKEFNAIIMIEDVNVIDENRVEIEQGVTPWQHVRTVGESLVKGELILPANHQLTAYDIGLVLEGGITEINVYRQPSVEIIPTGTELVEPGESLNPGQIVEYNSHVLGGLVEDWGGKSFREEIVPDNYQLIKEKINEAVNKRDLVVVTAGSSAGREDFTAQIIEDLGEVLVHGVSMKPGGPVILGKIRNTPIIGVPGYPVAAALTFRIFARPLIYQLGGSNKPESRKVTAQVGSKVVSKLGFREFVRVKLAKLDNNLIAVPLARSSGKIGSLVEADGLMVISEFSEGVTRQAEVELELLADETQAEEVLIMSGSNDLILDSIKNELAQKGIDLLTKSTGSLGGLTALKRDEAHLAGIHLLDTETEEYNYSYVEKYLVDKETTLINLVYRQQGLMVSKGNPKKLQGIKDLANDDILFINRQRGAGTRILFDYKLNKAGISPTQINGYDRIEYTHMTLAAVIANGGADVGLGILAAAQAFDLGFIPVAEERYDLVIPKKYQHDRRVKKLLEIIHSDQFKQKVASLSGYNTSKTGQVMKND